MNGRDALNKSHEIMEAVFPRLDEANKEVPGSIQMFVRRICNRFGLVQPWPETEPETTPLYDAEIAAAGLTPTQKNQVNEARHLSDELEMRVFGPAMMPGVRPDDPWKHRSDGMRCSTCMWFVEKDRRDGIHRDGIGRCRRHAPTLGGYPVVKRDDWCGDHKLDENKA